MKKYVRWTAFGIVLITLVALVAWGYSYTSPLTPRGSKEWSRGHIIGRTPVRHPVAMHPAPDGGVFVVWPNLEDELELIYIDVDGETLLHRALEVGAEKPRDPQLLVGTNGRLHLAWRELEEPHATIRHVLLEDDGSLVNTPQVLSDPTRWVADAPRLVLDTSGSDVRVHTLWADEVGIQWAVLSARGELVREPVLLAEEGRSPMARMGGQGGLHLAWQERLDHNTQGVYYAALDPQTGELSEIEEIAEIFRRTGQWIEGPTISLDQEMAYVLWVLKDMREVSSRSRYAFFPLDLPRQKRIENLWLERGVNPSGLTTLNQQLSSPLMALSAEVSDSEWFSEAQIILLHLAPGETPDQEIWGWVPGMGGGVVLSPLPGTGLVPAMEVRQEVVSGSHLPSIEPVLTMDASSHLHLTWLETGGFSQYRVVYASNAPEVKQNYNALTLWDIVDPLFRHVLRLSLIVLVAGPMFILWALAPMGGLLIYHLITGEEELELVSSRVILGAVLALEVGLTILFPPFSPAWAPLRWVGPLATATLAGGLTFLALRRGGASLLFSSFFLFTGIHSVAQLIIYFVV